MNQLSDVVREIVMTFYPITFILGLFMGVFLLNLTIKIYRYFLYDCGYPLFPDFVEMEEKKEDVLANLDLDYGEDL